MTKSFIELFAASVSAQPDKTALVADDQTLAYAELDALSDTIASALVEAGAAPGSRVPVLLRRGSRAVAAMLGVWKAGCVLCVVSPEYPRERIDYIRRECAALLLMDDAWLDSVQGMTEKSERRVPNPDEPGLVVFTSGSTGNPKGVVIPHRAISMAVVGNILGRTAEDVFLSVASFSFVAVVFDVMTPLALGATLHIAPEQSRRDVSWLAGYVRTNGVTSMFLPPQTAAQFLAVADGVLSSLVVGSEKVSRLHSARTRIINTYGASETCGPMASFPIDKPYDATPVGLPHAGSAMYILDDDLRRAEAGEVGEICVSGQVALGYLNNPDQTADRFVANPFATGPNDRTLYRTGDLGRMRPDGVVEYVQRKDWMLKVRGHRVEPGEIEAAMVARAPIDRAVVVGFDNANGETSLYACYTASRPVPPAEVEAAIAGFLPPYMIPTFMEQVQSIPVNQNGKVDRKNIRPPDAERYKSEYVAPEGDAEARLAAAFERILGVGNLGALDDFKALGGDSISAVRLQALLPDMGLSVADILELRTPRALAATARQGDGLAKADHREDWPLTFAERQMATEQGMTPDSVAYNVNLAFHLEGRLDETGLENALSQLTARHRILRSYYVMEDGEFRHRIADSVNIALARENRSAEEIPARIAALNAPFRLDEAPLLRATLFAAGPDSHVLNLCLHHIIIDGVSGGLLLDELWRLYEDRAEKPDACRPDYLDYAVWQNGRDDAAGREFFQTMFADGVPENEMPTRPTRPDVLPFATALIERGLDARSVADAARRRGVTPYTLLIAAAELTLAKYVGNDDVVLGAAMNGRDLPEAAGMIGMFVNTVPVRFKPDRNGTLNAHIEQVAGVLAKAREHQTTPFEILVPILAPDRNASRNPVYDVIVNYLEEIPTRVVDTLAVSRLPIRGQALAIDLQLEIVRDGDAMRAELAYSPELYQPEIAQGILEQFAVIVERICRDDGETLADVMELPEAHRRQILVDFLPEQSDANLGRTLVELFRESARRHSRRPAVVAGSEVLDYQTVDAMTDRLAAHLAAKGIGPGKTVGVLVRRHAMMVIGSLGVLKTGAAYVPLDPTYPPERLEFMLEDAGAGLAIMDGDLRDLLPGYQGECLVSEDVRTLPASAPIPAGPASDDTVVLLYTSGTTGKPKGVMLTHANLVAFCSWFDRNYGLTETDNVAAYASYGFDACLMDLYPTLLAGACVHIVPEEMRLDLPALNAYFNANAVSVAFMTTQLGRQFAESMDNHSLRALTTGGETLVPLPPPANFSLYNAYGPTECTVFATLFKVDRLYDRVPLGRPLANTAIYILDKHNRLAPVGAAGELCIAGRQVAKGYLNRPELTAEKFVANPFSDDPAYARMYRTGDVARYLPSGDVDFIGRRDFQVKIRGFRVELTEIEGRIRMYPGIADAAVIARDAPAGGKCAVAYIVADAPVDISSLNAFIEETLPPYMVPSATMQLEAIPLNPNGKVDRRKLPEPVYARDEADGEADTRVATDLEAVIKEVAVGVLGHEQFGPTTDLLRAGLTSLSAIKLAARLQDRLGAAPSVRDLMRNPNVIGIENAVVGQLLELVKNPSAVGAQNARAEEAPAADYPLSQSQLGVCIDCMRRPETLAYNIPLRVDFPPTVDAERLARAAEAVINAHPVVKARLTMRGEEVRQVPGDAPAAIPVQDAGPDDLDAIARDFVKPFPLFEGPLYRGRVARTKTGVSLFVDFHHIVFDGGSLDVFLRQLGSAYDGGLTQADGEKRTLFACAASEEREEGSVRWLEDKAYFDRELAGFEGASEIAPDLPHSDAPGKMAEVVRTVPAATVDAFCREFGVTPAGLFLAAVSYAVGRWVNTRDVYLSTISSGRADPGLENSFGMFVRTLPLAIHFGEPERTALDYVRVCQQALSDAIHHEGYPFTRVAQDHGYEPAIMFAFELGVTSEYRVGGQRAVLNPLAAAETKFKLSIHVEEREGAPAFAVQYDDSLYSNYLMERFVDTLATALDNIAAAPSARVRALSLVSPKQRTILESFNRTDGELPEAVLHRMFEAMTDAHPERVALIAAEGEYTYRELDAEANRLANALIGMGVGMEDRVAFMLNRTGRVLIAMLGILKAGGCYIPVDPAYPADRIRHVLDDSAARFLLTTPDRAAEFPAAKDIDALRAGGSPNRPGLSVRPEQLAYMIYTSGSTGKPKGVMIEHRGIANYVTDHPRNQHVHGLVTDARAMMSITTVAFDMFLKESMTALANGKTLVFADDTAAYDPTALAELFARTGADAFNATPSRMLEYMESPDLCRAILGCRVIMAGAEKYPEALLAKLRGAGGRLFNTYGPTEITVSSNCKELTHADRVTIGAPLLGVHEYVVDLDGNALPCGVVGELWIGGRGVARGYLNLPEQTAERFIRFNGERVYKSGDLARWTGDGEIELLGRNDNQIKLRGLRIELGEIENAIVAYPGIRTCAVAIRKIKNTDHIAAYYVAAEEIDPRDLRETLAKTLAPYMVPTAYLQIPSMPKTPNGKDDIRNLPDAELLRVHEYARPENELEETLCGVFAKVLELDEVGANDSFFDIGGTSLAVTRVIIEAKERGVRGPAGETIAYGDVFANPTPRDLAKLLTGGGAAPAPREPEAEYDYAAIDALLSRNTLDAYRAGGARPLGNMLLTGATGFLGIHILKEYLDGEDGAAYCLLRRGRHASAETRLKNMLFYYFEDSYEHLLGKRLFAIEGDVTDTWSLKQIDALPVDTIINSAANVSHFAKGNEIYDVNTRGALNLIDVAKRKDAQLVQLSTHSIAGFSIDDSPRRDVKLDETMLFFGQNLENQYVSSKFLAERAVLEAALAGLDVKIMRMGNLMARNRDGEFQINSRANSFLGRLRAYQAVGRFPYSAYHSPAELAPIDSSARAVLLLCQTPPDCRVFHPYNNHYLFMGDIVAIMREAGIDVQLAEDDEYQAALAEALRDKSKAERLVSLVAYQNMAQGKAAVPLGSQNDYTSQILYRKGWRWPETSSDYLRKFLEGMIGLGYFGDANV